MILYSAESATQVALDGIQCLGESRAGLFVGLIAGESQARCEGDAPSRPP